jgi:hypothetical protein
MGAALGKKKAALGEQNAKASAAWPYMDRAYHSDNWSSCIIKSYRSSIAYLAFYLAHAYCGNRFL